MQFSASPHEQERQRIRALRRTWRQEERNRFLDEQDERVSLFLSTLRIVAHSHECPASRGATGRNE